MKPPRTKLLDHRLELKQITPEARRQAACVLEVLAGIRTPQQATEALGVSLPTYYNLEIRALRGLVGACTPEPPGRLMDLARKLRLAEGKSAALEKQVQRYQSLLRNAQRSIGLLPPPPAPAKAAGKRKPRKPTVRALRAVESLQRVDGTSPGGSALGEACAPVVAEAG